jgi:hypothetical protein
MSDTAATHSERIMDLADKALDTHTAALLLNYQAMSGLISRVAAPGHHIDQAIELITERRDEAETIARHEFEQLTEAEQRQFRLGVCRHVMSSMILAADMLARTGALMQAPDPHDIPPDVVAITAAMLMTSGLINDARQLMTDADS